AVEMTGTRPVVSEALASFVALSVSVANVRSASSARRPPVVLQTTRDGVSAENVPAVAETAPENVPVVAEMPAENAPVVADRPAENDPVVADNGPADTSEPTPMPPPPLRET